MKHAAVRMQLGLVFGGLVVMAGFAGCLPGADEGESPPDAATPDVATPAFGAPEADAEGSEPKTADEPTLKPAAAGVDRSITDAAAYGDDALVADLVPEGWMQAGPIEHYNVASLYTKINGRSELYMAYNVLGMSWVSFIDRSDKAGFLDLFIYDMRSPTNAFGIYSIEREKGQPPVPLGREGYRTGSNYYFWKGNYYGYINASRENDRNGTAGLGIAIALMQRITDSREPVAGLDWLPEDGLINDTVQYFKADAMSLDFLTETFIGEYRFGDGTVRAFVSKRASEDDAARILEQFAVYGDDYAEGGEKLTVGGVEVTLIDWGDDYYDAMFRLGPMVAGLTNVQGKDVAERALDELIGKLEI